MINGHEVISDCPHYGLCTHVLYVGRCMKECFKRREKEMGTGNYAFWQHRGAHNDYIWAECSNCGFREENWKVAKLGKSDTDYVGVKWNYCPNCGKEMRV